LKKKNKKMKYMSAVVISSFLVSTIQAPIVTYAETTNPELPGSPQRIGNGSSYWETSTIREWLNSHTTQVQYTNEAPTTTRLGTNAFDKEAGFLNSFTQDEQNAIAVTERRSFINGASDSLAREGGSRNVPRDDAYSSSPFVHFASPNIQNVWNSVYYQTTKDKVFILSPMELYEYVQKRGIPYKKGLTQSAKTKFNINSSSYNWISTGARSDVWGENIFAVNDSGNVYYSTPRGNGGIVPAIHVKPDYTFKNGKQAKNLTIGEKVLFGQYGGEEIEWEVINKTPEGYPLLWSSDVLTIKVFDTPGDQSYKNSESITFGTADVSIKDSFKVLNPKSTDITPPVLKVVNETDLNSPKSGEWTIILEATDESGVQSIKLPNGTIVNGSRVEYPVSSNGYYHFEATDKAGNHYGSTIPVGNIQPPASVVIQSSANGWTNKDVTVDIFASDADAGWERSSIAFDTTAVSGGVWPEYSSYAGKRVRVTAKVRLVSYKQDVQNYNAQVRYSYFARVKSGNDYLVQARYPVVQNIPLRSLLDGSTKSFDATFTIPGDYFGRFNPVLQVDIAPQLAGLYKVEYTDVKYELLDKEDFGIEKIILPNGTEIFSNSYKDTLSQEGTYLYKVVDSRGMTTQKSISVKIDKTNPSINISGNPTGYTNQDITLKIDATDGLSGVKRVLKPNGEWENKASFDYNVYQNGSYTFKVEDNAGNITTKTVVVDKIDKSAPLLDSSLSPSGWTNQNVTVQLNASDEEGEIAYIELPNGNRVASNTANYTVSANGEYDFTAQDKVGYQTAKSVRVSNIDKEKPTAKYEITHSSGDNYSIKLTAEDNLSGVKRIKLPNGTYTSGSNATYLVKKGETVSFEVEDNAGNVLVYEATATPPELTVYQKDNYVKAEWAVEMLDQDVLYQTGFESVDELPLLSYSGGLPENRLYGGQSFVNQERFQGDKSLKIVNSYLNGNYKNVDLNGNVSYQDYSVANFTERKYMPNGTNLSVSFRAKTTGNGNISVTGIGGAADFGQPLDITFLEPVKKGDRTVKVSNPGYFKNYVDQGKHFYLANQKGRYSYIHVTSVNMNDSTITLNSSFQGEFERGDNVLKHNHRNPVNFANRSFEGKDGWALFNVNTKVANLADYNTMTRGFQLWINTITPDTVYIDDLKMGYATKTRLYRGDTMLYEGYLSDYEDKEATDKEKPNSVSTLQVKSKEDSIVMDIERPFDNGTPYEYTVKAVSNKGDIISSEKKNVTVTSGVDGYSYVIDTNATTIPDDSIDSRNDSVSIPVTSNAKHYIHIKAIDKAGNVSSVSHIPFQDNIAPSLTLAQNPTAWTNSAVQITATARDEDLSVRRIKLPNGNWQNGETVTYPVTSNGTYTFVAEDLVGNQTSKSITITNIDTTPPTAPSISNNEDWTKTTPVQVTITPGTDTQSGVKRIEYKLEGATSKSWTSYSGSFSISNEGITKVIARTVDNLEQYSPEAVSYVRIDKSAPYNMGITIKLKEG
jgi:co-chaperonin GroES (HSP10)